MAPKPRSEPGLYINNRKEMRRILVPGARITVLEAERRDNTGAPFVPWDHRSLGLLQTVVGDENGAPVLSDSSVFDTGSAKEWTFEDGLAVRETAVSRVVYRLAAAAPDPGQDDEYPELARLSPNKGVLTPTRVAALTAAQDEYRDAVHASMSAAGLNPGAAFGAMDEVLGARRTASRMLDGTQSKLRDLDDAEWLAARDRLFSEGLELALAENSAWTTKLSAGRAHIVHRIAESRAAGKPVAAEEDHLEDLNGALRGLRGEAQLLGDRVARAANVA